MWETRTDCFRVEVAAKRKERSRQIHSVCTKELRSTGLGEWRRGKKEKEESRVTLPFLAWTSRWVVVSFTR